MRLLGVRDGAFVEARLVRHGLRAVLARGMRAGGVQRRARERHGVGAHVRDVPRLVEALGEAHRRLRREAQLAARLLLERRGAEGRRGPAGVRLLVDAPHRERLTAELRDERARPLLVEHENLGRCRAVLAEVTSTSDADAVDRDEPRRERSRVERAEHVPVARGDESHPLPLAVDHEPRGDGLHAPGRKARHDLLPQDRRHLEAVEPVEDAARLLGVDEPLVDLARLVERAVDRVLRDLVEDHPAHRNLRLQHLLQVPGDGLALPVLVRREQQLVGSLQLLLEVGDDPFLVVVDDVVRLELAVDVHAELPVAGAIRRRDVRGPVREVADVADARLDDEVAAEVAGDRPRLGGRLHDDEAGWHGVTG